MVKFECDQCKKQTFANCRNGDGIAQLPTSWMKHKIKMSTETKEMLTIHFCSLSCIQKFNETDFIKSYRKGQ